MEENKVIYSMSGVGKVVDDKKYILKDIYLGYYYGAKMGKVLCSRLWQAWTRISSEK